MSAWKESLLEQMYLCLSGNSGSAALWPQHTSVQLILLTPDTAVSLTNLEVCIHICIILQHHDFQAELLFEEGRVCLLISKDTSK